MMPESHDADRFRSVVLDRFNMSLGAGLGRFKGRAFRIGHLGDLNEIMCLMAISGSEMAMRDLGIPVEAGSGVAAAIEYYRGATAASLKSAA